MDKVSYEVLAWLASAGSFIGLGQLLMSDEPLTLRRALGRAIVTGGLSVGSACILLAIPGLGIVPLVGVACAVSSLGASGLEKLLARVIPTFGGKKEE